MPDAVRPELRGRGRPGGTIGIRHHLLVIPSVLCAAQAAKVIAEGMAGAVAIEHQHGCSQLGGDAHLTEQILTGLGIHPNVAGTLVVSLGCETVQGLHLFHAIQGRGQRAEFVGIQQAGGTLAAIEAGREALARLRTATAADPDLPMPRRALRVGVEAAWLALPARQAAVFARVIDRLLADGAVVIQAVPAAETPPAPHGPPDAPPPPLLGRPVSWAAYAAPIPASGQGLFLMPAPRTRIAQKTGLAAAGAQVIVSPLVEGLPAGSPVAPVVHVGIAPYARPFAHDVEVMLEMEPAPGADAALLEALDAACRDETITEAIGMFEMAIHRIGPTM